MRGRTRAGARLSPANAAARLAPARGGGGARGAGQ